jgi:NAD-dependent DNA ligase
VLRHDIPIKGMSIMSEIKEFGEYSQYCDQQKTYKAFRTLEGILKGINIDNDITHTEIVQLNRWCEDYHHVVNRYPFNEIIALILSITEDGIITEDEYEDIVWACNNIIMPNKYNNMITAGIQQLHGILHGILSDGIITKQEVEGLQDWINDNQFMIGTYPYDEIDTLLCSILEDGVVSKKEQNLLKVYFSQFVDIENTAINTSELEKLKKSIQLPVICSMNPHVIFNDKLFCFTGISLKENRKMVADIVVSHGGTYLDKLRKDTDYLIIGDKNNPCWVFSCYGRKIEQALEYRTKGVPIQVIKETDFWDETYNQ